MSPPCSLRFAAGGVGRSAGSRARLAAARRRADATPEIPLEARCALICLDQATRSFLQSSKPPRRPTSDLGEPYLWGLFTNMAPADMQVYVREISRVAKQGARVFLTAFVEERVPAVSLNPQDYVNYKCSGPLHVVRYERQFLFGVFAWEGDRVAWPFGVAPTDPSVRVSRT